MRFGCAVSVPGVLKRGQDFKPGNFLFHPVFFSGLFHRILDNISMNNPHYDHMNRLNKANMMSKNHFDRDDDNDDDDHHHMDHRCDLFIYLFVVIR